MRQFKQLLDAPPADSPRERQWATVDFPAWKYERSERLWAALAKAVYEQPQLRMSWRERLLFRVRLEWRRLGWWRFGLKIVWPSLAAAAAVVVTLQTDLSADGTAIAVLSTGAAACAAMARYAGLVTDPFKRAIERYASRPDYEAHLGFTAEADHDVRTLTQVLAPDGSRALAVFVDDLDRCSSAHVVEVVEAMSQIFNAAPDHRVAFVLGLDRDVVATNIEVAYGDTVSALRRGGSPVGTDFGLEFLAKLVQLSVRLPRPSEEAIAELLAHVTGNSRPAKELPESEVQRVLDDLQGQPLTLEEMTEVSPEAQESATPLSESGDGSPSVADAAEAPRVVAEAVRRARVRRIRDSPEVVAAEFRALRCLDRNPRQVKRFHNAFRLQLYVANENDDVPFDFSRDHLEALAAWVAISMRWPALADHLTRDPDLLITLEDVANGATASPETRDRFVERHARDWIADQEVLKAFHQPDPGRRISTLRLESFLRVA